MLKLTPGAGSKIQRRPLTRRQPPSSSKTRIIFISSKTPFMAAATRVRKTLDRAHRSHQNNAAASKQASLASRIASLERSIGRDDGGADGKRAEVIFAGTGRALEKVLSLAGWFEQEGDCEVEVRTGTVGVVDDIVDEDGDEEGSRVRKTSRLEVTVRLK